MEGTSSYRERRQHRRFSVELPLDYWEAPDALMGGLVADISETGLRIRSVLPIQIGAELKIRVYVPKDEYTFGSIDGMGKIIWRKLHRDEDWTGFQYGLYLTEMSLNDKERLKQLLRGQQEDQQDILETLQSHPQKMKNNIQLPKNQYRGNNLKRPQPIKTPLLTPIYAHFKSLLRNGQG